MSAKVVTGGPGHGSKTRNGPATKWITGSAITLAGVGQIVWSALTGSAYMQDLLINAGVATLLVVPLWFVQRTLDLRITKTEEDTKETRMQVAALGNRLEQELGEVRAEVRGAVRAENEAREDLFGRIASVPSRDDVQDAIERLTADRTLSDQGFRVLALDGLASVYLRFHVTDGQLGIRVEDRAGKEVDVLTWVPSMTPSGVLTGVMSLLRKHAGLADEDGDLAGVFVRLSEGLRVANAHRGKYAFVENLDSAVEYVAPQWMVYEWGLSAVNERMGQPYYVRLEDLTDPRQVLHMRDKEWVDEDCFRRAFLTLGMLHGTVTPQHGR